MKKRVLLLAPLLIACGPFFYVAPPPLENYPQRIPGKSWREILTETLPPPAQPATIDQSIAEARALGALLPDLVLEDRLARVDALIARNRDGEFNVEVANYLNELRELVPNHGLLLAAQPYLREREERLGAYHALPHRPWREIRAEAGEKLDKGLALAPPSLEPNYRVQKAAHFYNNGATDDALNEFRAVMADYPDHPRAEVACFMIGRCLPPPYQGAQDFERLDEYELQEHFEPAVEAFEAYLAKYPKGRFVADAHGWLASLMARSKRPGEAVSHQLARWSARPARMDLRCVLRDCEEIFATLLKDPAPGDNVLPWDEMAKRPEVARLFVFQALDPAARDGLPQLDRNLSSDGVTLNFLHRRIIVPRPFVRRALMALGHAVLNAREGNPDAFTLLVLGWASQLGNEPAQALALFDRALAITKTDDLLQGRAMALGELGRHGEAAAAYQELASAFPASPLVKATEFERAIAQFRAGEAGDALVHMLGRLTNQYGGLPEGETLYPEFELRQWVDSVAQFGGIEALAKPLATLPPDDPRAVLLRAVVRYRALAAHRFDLARQYVDPVPTEPRADGDDGMSYILGYEVSSLLPMDEARWQRDVAPLAEAYQRLEAGSAKDAALHLEIGRRWKALRGRVVYPLHGLFDYSRSENEKLDLLRRRNAAYLGVPAETIASELDSRDELDHALAHFRKAAELSHDPEIAAPALEEANEVLFRLAEFSHYRVTRAIESDAAGFSTRLVARLRSDFPDRPETQRAATWTFTPPVMMGRWMPGDYTPDNSAGALLGSLEYLEPTGMLPRVVRGEKVEGESIEASRERLQLELAEFNISRPSLAENVINTYGSLLDDLVSAAALPEITPELFASYEKMRRGGGSGPDTKGDGAILKAHVEFFYRACASYDWPDPDETIESWQDYLARYPDGPKTEPASLRLLRLRVRAFAPVPMIRAFHFPEAPIANGYKRLIRPKAMPAEELEALKRDIAAHEAKFPGGRYAADLAQLSAAVAAQSGDYGTAIAKLSGILADPMHPELRMTTALYFAEISQRLLDPEQRAAVATGFRRNPAALPWLRKLVMGDTCLFRLRPLMPWLEQSDLQLPPPPP